MDDGFVFGRKGDSYIILHAMSDGEATLAFKTDVESDITKIKDSVRELIEATGDLRYDLILDGGSNHAWITELGSVVEWGSFNSFVSEMLKNETSFNDMTVLYNSGEKAFDVKYDVHFKLNGQVVDTNYARYENAYVDGKIERGAKTMTFTFGGHSLTLNFDCGTREEN
jgi:hypothetical protein